MMHVFKKTYNNIRPQMGDLNIFLKSKTYLNVSMETL